MDNSIPITKREQLKQKFVKSKKAIEALFKQFNYDEEVSHYDSMKKLCACLENVMNVDSLYDFSKYLNNQAHLPIQLNFKYIYNKIELSNMTNSRRYFKTGLGVSRNPMLKACKDLKPENTEIFYLNAFFFNRSQRLMTIFKLYPRKKN